jgi:hypothetical protein
MEIEFKNGKLEPITSVVVVVESSFEFGSFLVKGGSTTTCTSSLTND